MSKRPIVGGVVAFTVFWVFITCVAYGPWHNYERLAHTGVQAFGTVTAKEPNNHQSIRYEYFVGSTRYTGISTAGFGGLPPFAQIRVGDQIPVSFLPQYPTISLPGDPKDLYTSWSGLLFIVAPGMGLVAGTITAFRLHLKNRQRSNQTMQRTAGNLSSRLSMKFHHQPAATRHPASRR